MGHRSATICHLGNIGYQLRKPLRWDPAKERFVEDDEANKLVARVMRERAAGVHTVDREGACFGGVGLGHVTTAVEVVPVFA